MKAQAVVWVVELKFSGTGFLMEYKFQEQQAIV